MAVVKQIMNRRQGVMINAIDPEILTESKLSTDGFVKNTDYATSDTAGVIKYTNNLGTNVNNSGVLTGITRSDTQYASASNGLFICKGTLENVALPLVQSKMQADMGALYENAEVGDTWTVILRKTADGLVFDYEPTT